MKSRAILITGGTGFIGAEIVRGRIPEAQISFEPNAILQPAIDQAIRPLDDRRARAEWSWEPAYDQEAIVEDFLAEWRDHRGRYL
jgi:nucleoside-diphosphate-sugar epimerase